MPYSPEAVNACIASSNRAGRKIGKREATAIHRLLAGRGYRPTPGERLLEEAAAHADDAAQISALHIPQDRKTGRGSSRPFQ